MEKNDDEWKREIESAVSDFLQVARIAGDARAAPCWNIEYLPAPHKPPGLPGGKMAVYAFWGDGGWLKIGKVGPNSDARYRSQHYAPERARSSLAQSLLNDVDCSARCLIDAASCTEWIKANTHRCNILLPATEPKSLLSLLEAFLHHRLKPRYEG
jgi:hypothetical protein